MKIAVNTRLLLKDKLEGIGWVAYETLRRMVKSHPEVEFYFLFDREPDPMFVFGDNVKPVVLFPQARHPRKLTAGFLRIRSQLSRLHCLYRYPPT